MKMTFGMEKERLKLLPW